MPGFILDQTSTVTCSHAGMGQPIGIEPRVRVGGSPVVVFTTMYAIAGCTLSGATPCTTGKWLVGAGRVRANGKPVIVTTSMGLCPPAGKLTIVSTQTRVTAT